ncbi:MULTISPECIES: YceH family protein [unclassified Salinivibrio]|uniref:YceH family protein n=1 Tax=unclassified Salinivibrio TaxID=2636825 RepID=UPI00128B2CB2|nr:MULTISPECIES: DUF480 domain-containing protein [unclassified Salinivibrio]MPS31118.1 DUF480 domain-containing protein [Salinivibrio sp. VYel7]MPX92519.1 DUF480 domain-containing protein [Salinivibrio sp. VYel9]MPX96983.1 DUF480 domain-containing protein [Salinivibrio sp. VYel6]MPX98751.1 DUF480 domain-containing protein [Salinivibrio sp. VYel4]MPY01548.1 DUF480 domain-containing protein [Salinivibrio sp. VYel5]
MSRTLSPYQQRVIGCLLEKEVTTPDHYPLTLNALTTAVNQKSNRDPVYEMADSEVLDIVETLIEMRLVSPQEGSGGRVAKYQHRFCNTQFGDLTLSEPQKAILCVMLLRGAQTPGELRTRTQRLYAFNRVEDVERTLADMITSNWVKKLPREAGKRESRYQHLFTDGVNMPTNSAPQLEPEPTTDASLVTRVSALEQEVAELRQMLEAVLER